MCYGPTDLARSSLIVMPTARNEHDRSNPAHSYVEQDCTKPERPVGIYSYVGSPSDNVARDGDFLFEEITGSLIGPKANGKWPEDFKRIEDRVVGKHRCYPRWRSLNERVGAREGFLSGWFKRVIRFLRIGGCVKPHSAGSGSSNPRSLRNERAFGG